MQKNVSKKGSHDLGFVLEQKHITNHYCWTRISDSRPFAPVPVRKFRIESELESQDAKFRHPEANKLYFVIPHPNR